MNEPARTAGPCRPDCRFFSTYTNTCDYTLLMYRSRGCPRDACTKYEKRTSPRPWNRVACDPEDFYFSAKEEDPMYVPEPPVLPPEDVSYVTAGCGHEVYEGEELFEWENGATLCPDCLEDRFMEMSLTERAELLGCEHRAVAFPKRGERYEE